MNISNLGDAFNTVNAIEDIEQSQRVEGVGGVGVDDCGPIDFNELYQRVRSMLYPVRLGRGGDLAQGPEPVEGLAGDDGSPEIEKRGRRPGEWPRDDDVRITLPDGRIVSGPDEAAALANLRLVLTGPGVPRPSPDFPPERDATAGAAGGAFE